mgnify:CR=1 FL=1
MANERAEKKGGPTREPTLPASMVPRAKMSYGFARAVVNKVVSCAQGAELEGINLTFKGREGLGFREGGGEGGDKGG